MTTTRFRMGADVPEWLLTLEPMHPQARKENFRFMVDVDVVETTDNFIVVPAVYGPYESLLDMRSVQGCKMFAPGKVTRLAVQLSDVFADGMGPLVPLGGPVQPVPAVQLGPEIQPPMPRLTFWQRLRYTFTGY